MSISLSRTIRFPKALKWRKVPPSRRDVKGKQHLQHIFINRPIHYNPKKVTKQTLQSEIHVGEGECSPSPSLHFTSQRAPSPPTITAGLMGIHTDGAADAVISHSLWETSPRQESCDPGKMGPTCTRARCIHDGPGSSGSDTIWVKCPVGQSKFGETVSNNEMGDEVERVFFCFFRGFFFNFCQIHMQQQSRSKRFFVSFSPPN